MLPFVLFRWKPGRLHFQRVIAMSLYWAGPFPKWTRRKLSTETQHPPPYLSLSLSLSVRVLIKRLTPSLDGGKERATSPWRGPASSYHLSFLPKLKLVLSVTKRNGILLLFCFRSSLPTLEGGGGGGGGNCCWAPKWIKHHWTYRRRETAQRWMFNGRRPSGNNVTKNSLSRPYSLQEDER